MEAQTFYLLGLVISSVGLVSYFSLQAYKLGLHHGKQTAQKLEINIPPIQIQQHAPEPRVDPREEEARKALEHYEEQLKKVQEEREKDVKNIQSVVTAAYSEMLGEEESKDESS